VGRAGPPGGHTGEALVRAHADLLDAYSRLRRITKYVEHSPEDADNDRDKPTPRRFKHDHAEWIKERYPDGPVLNLAIMLLEHNRREWLWHQDKTGGTEVVRRHGLTANQRRWLDDLAEAREATEAWGDKMCQMFG
jgi:hypothetical protein